MGLIDSAISSITSMAWKPALRVTVNGSDVTSAITGALRSLTLTDTAGIQSDSVDISLAGEVLLQTIALPATGAEMEIALGYGLTPKKVGLYVVEETGVQGGPGGETITIRGYAASYGDSDEGKSGLNTSKSRSWAEGTKVSAMVEKIAKEAGFKSSVTTEAGEIELPHLDQINESDMALLTRVARENGLIFKPGGGTLAMRTAGEATTASGSSMPTVTLTKPECSSWGLSVRRPEAVKQVVTTYRNIKTAKTVQVTQDAPTYTGGTSSTATSTDEAQASADKLLSGVSSTKTIVHPAPTQASAKTKAKADAQAAYRKSQQVTVTLPGRADMTAEGRLTLSGFRSEMNKEWLIVSVTHSIDSGGWRTTVQAELPPK